MYHKFSRTKGHLVVAVLTILFPGAIPLAIAQAQMGCTSSRTLNVLIIEQDPFLKTRDNMRSSVYLNQDKDLVVNDLVDDIKFSSHGNVIVNIVKKEHLDEFATFLGAIRLKNGGVSKTLDEETWLELMKNGWYEHGESPFYADIKYALYDYEYIMDKFDLINRRNNGEFDEVWLVSVDPEMCFESIMVGSSAYWINGYPIIKNTTNFKLISVSIARPDANFECFGHAAENILRNVFGSRFESYQKDAYNVTNINDLNPWERFTLNNYATPGYSSAGNVHFAPNSVADYDWENKTIVQSSWIDWLDYPNLTGRTKASNSEDWVPFTNNQFSAARQHHRWWFSLMPHICEGRTKEGYSNNWWDYLFNGDYVTNITNNSSKTDYQINECITLDFKLDYLTGKVENKTIDIIGINDLNIQIENDEIVKLENGMLKAKSAGNTDIRVYYDNKYADFSINVSSTYINDENTCISAENTFNTALLQFFPNPAKDEIFIKTGLKVEKIEIWSLMGTLFIMENNPVGTISVSALPQGIYLFKVYTDKGLEVRKIMKE